jgi:hypothetical protein
MHKIKVVLFGAAGAGLATIVNEVTAKCPDLVAAWPTVLTTGLMAAWGFWLRSPKDNLADNPNAKPIPTPLPVEPPK